MAFSGVHIVCGVAGGRYIRAASRLGAASLPIHGEALWSETMPNAGVTADAAPREHAAQGALLMSVRAAEDIWVATGRDPDAGQGRAGRSLVPAGVERDFVVKAGDRLAWIPA